MVRSLNPEKREKFLNSALKLFVENGVQNTTTAAIAQEAGTGAGTLFLYFPTKQALINELVLAIGRQHLTHMQSLLAPVSSVKDTFLMIWEGSIHYFSDNITAYQYLQQVRNSGWIDEATVNETAGFYGYYYDAIQKGNTEGSIKPYPMEMVGEFLYQDIVAVMNILSNQPDISKQEAIIRQGFEIFWEGIEK